MEFYTGPLGFQESGTKEVPQNIMETIFNVPFPCRLTKLRKGQVILEVFSHPDFDFNKENPQSSGYNHWALVVEDKMSFLQMAQRKGVELVRADQEKGEVWFIKDPDGNLIEIYERRDKK